MTRYSRLWLVVLGLMVSAEAICESRGIVADFVMRQSQAIGEDNSIEHTVFGEFARDVDGRTIFSTERMQLITDPVALRSWRVDTVQGVAFEHKLDAVYSPPTDGGKMMSDGWTGQFAVSEGEMPTFDEKNLKTIELGLETINGVECTGRRWTYSIPADAIGNVNPIEVVTETWVSDMYGFQLPVKTVVQSDVSGIQTRELRHIRETTFDRAHFKPDANYQVRVVEKNVLEK